MSSAYSIIRVHARARACLCVWCIFVCYSTVLINRVFLQIQHEAPFGSHFNFIVSSLEIPVFYDSVV